MPCWPHWACFSRLHSATWAGRIAAWEQTSGAALVLDTPGSFFGDRLTADLLAVHTHAVGMCDEG